MKKSELKAIIKECIQELNESNRGGRVKEEPRWVYFIDKDEWKQVDQGTRYWNKGVSLDAMKKSSFAKEKVNRMTTWKQVKKMG